MAAIVQRRDSRIQLFDPEETRQAFDAQARELMGMSGEEFIRRWDAGEFATIADDAEHPEVMRLALLIPFGR